MKWKELHIEQVELSAVLERLDSKCQRIISLRPLPSIAMDKIKEALHLEWTYNSNSIEGNTLTLQETRVVLLDGITVKGKSLREHFEAVNHHEAIEHVEALVKPDYRITEGDILDVHEMVLDKISREYAGRLRTAGVRITGANFTPPNALKVPELLQDLMHWTNEESHHLHPVVRAAVFHHRFVWIHPFFDGNGRSARLLFNLLLMKDGYPPAIILKVDRKKYYDSLNKANQGDYQKLISLVMQSLERTIDIYLSNLEDRADEYQPITDIAEDPAVPYGQEYISLLARTGKINAYKEGRIWYTTGAAIAEYQSRRQRKSRS